MVNIPNHGAVSQPLVFLAAFLIGSTTSTTSQLVSVIKIDDETLKVVEGHAVRPWVVRANLTDSQSETGWIHLDIVGNSNETDQRIALAAGVAEGYLTSFLTTQYYNEFIEKLCAEDREFCTWMKEQFWANRAWIENQLAEKGERDSYWNMVRLFYKQLDGLAIGWKSSTKSQLTPALLQSFDTESAFYFINFLPSLDQYIGKYKKIKSKDGSAGVQFPTCSVLIKKLEGRDCLVAHTAWHEYRAMGYRFLKRYSLPYRLENDRKVPGHTITMSSYAGSIYSLDDFYSISSGLVTTETTLSVFDETLYKNINPVGQLLEPVRVMLANRLSSTGKEWVNHFEQFNCGTYNNQWMVVDYNKVRSGSTTGVLHVLEQMPQLVHYEDVTDIFLRDGYWASYNRAYFDDIFEKSGAKGVFTEYGNWFSHGNTSRANIFRTRNREVTNKETMYKLMRSNDYETGQYNTPEGCSGPIPAAAIAGRTDVQSLDVTCTWSQLDPMEGRKYYGAMDLKMINSEDIPTQSFTAENGPTYQPPMKPFSWAQESGPDVPDFKPIRDFRFVRVAVTWSDLASGASSVLISYSILLFCFLSATV